MIILHKKQKYVSWKDPSNVIKYNVPILKINSHYSNNIECKSNTGCSSIYNSSLAFKAKPLKHYRKSLLDNTNCHYEYLHINKTCNTDISQCSFVIRPSTTVIDNNYSQNHQQYLYKKGLTFNQNLPQNNIDKGSFDIIDYKDKTCSGVVQYRNHKHRTNGPISGSARTASVKYQLCSGEECRDRITYNRIYLEKNNKYKPLECCNNKRRVGTRINLLK